MNLFLILVIVYPCHSLVQLKIGIFIITCVLCVSLKFHNTVSFESLVLLTNCRLNCPHPLEGIPWPYNSFHDFIKLLWNAKWDFYLIFSKSQRKDFLPFCLIYLSSIFYLDLLKSFISTILIILPLVIIAITNLFRSKMSIFPIVIYLCRSYNYWMSKVFLNSPYFKILFGHSVQGLEGNYFYCTLDWCSSPL